MCNFHFSGHIPYQAHDLEFVAGQEKNVSFEFPAFVFVSKGELNVFFPVTGTKKIPSGQMFILPQDIVCHLFCIENSTITVLEIPDLTALAIHFLPQVSFNKKYHPGHLFVTLPIKKLLLPFHHILQTYIQQGTANCALLEIKAMELFYLLGKTYSSEDLRDLFAQVLADGYAFALFVITHHINVKSVEELATLSHYSLSGFEKQFRKIFGIPPYKWMLQQKAGRIYHDILESNKPLKVIAQEYDFCNISHLGDFCRKHFGASPSYLRNKNKE